MTNKLFIIIQLVRLTIFIFLFNVSVYHICKPICFPLLLHKNQSSSHLKFFIYILFILPSKNTGY